MSEPKPFIPLAACESCNWEGSADDTKPIKDYFQRVYAGETVPVGECPECGALTHFKPDKRGWFERLYTGIADMPWQTCLELWCIFWLVGTTTTALKMSPVDSFLFSSMAAYLWLRVRVMVPKQKVWVNNKISFVVPEHLDADEVVDLIESQRVIQTRVSTEHSTFKNTTLNFPPKTLPGNL